jgi:hypothetical protein
MMRSRVGSDNARSDFKVEDIFCVVKLIVPSAVLINTGLQPGERVTLDQKPFQRFFARV